MPLPTYLMGYLIGALVSVAVALVCLVVGILLLNGKGVDKIAPYNTLPKERKERVDPRKVARFTGLFMVGAAVAVPVILIGVFLKIYLLCMLGLAYLLIGGGLLTWGLYWGNWFDK